MKPELFIKRLFQGDEVELAPNPLAADAGAPARRRRLLTIAGVGALLAIALVFAITHWPREEAKAPPVDSARR